MSFDFELFDRLHAVLDQDYTDEKGIFRLGYSPEETKAQHAIVNEILVLQKRGHTIKAYSDLAGICTLFSKEPSRIQDQSWLGRIWTVF